jgi:hypothetical protein
LEPVQLGPATKTLSPTTATAFQTIVSLSAATVSSALGVSCALTLAETSSAAAEANGTAMRARTPRRRTGSQEMRDMIWLLG